MGKRSNLKQFRKQFGKHFNKTAKELIRKATLVGHTDYNSMGIPYTTIYNPVKRLLKMKPYKSDVAKQVLAGTVEKYSNFLQQELKEDKKEDVTTSKETNIKLTKEN